MIEHVMAALAGMQVDNCEVWVDQAEMPGCDGSACPSWRRWSGRASSSKTPRGRCLPSPRPLRLGDEDCWIEARPGPAGKTVLQYELDYGSGNPIGRQSLEILLSPRFFHLNLAPSRTFLLEREAAALQDRGLGLRTTFQDLLVFDADGPIGNACVFPTSASATRSSTWSATWPWPAATWSAASSPTAAGTA